MPAQHAFGVTRASPTLPHLIALQPDVEPGTFILDEPECTLGRGAMCEVVLPFAFVSRLHSCIELVGGRYQIRDRRSVNGTFVNGMRLERPHVLSNHDVIGLGEAGPHLTYADPDPTLRRTSQLCYDERSMRFSINGTPLDLTPNQLRLLRFLDRNRGQVCSREQLAHAVWGEQFAPGMDATTLDRLISTLRAVLRDAAPECKLIVTRPGLGYELSDAADAAVTT
jgi:Transcriptional regulatory protein, C terminal/FHA domain